MNTKFASLNYVSADKFIHYATVDSSSTLESILQEITRTQTITVDGIAKSVPVYDCNHTWYITIAEGVNAFINNRYGNIYCNFHLKGVGTEKSPIYISQDVVMQTSGRGDAILAIQGEDTENRIKVSFENVDFMPVGAVPLLIFQSSDATDFKEEAIIVKIYFASKEVV